MTTIFECIQTGDANQATTIIERTLKAKALAAIKEHSQQVVTEFYGEVEEDVLDEADWKALQAKDWHYIAKKHGYTADAPEEKQEYGPTTQDFKTLKTTEGSAIGKSKTYQYKHPDGHKLTIIAHPQYGKSWTHEPKGGEKSSGREHTKLERKLLAAHNLKEAIENPNSSGQGYDPTHKDNPYHDTFLKHGYEYSHSTPVVYPSGRRIHHTYKHKELKDHVVGVVPTASGYEHTWQTHRLGSAPGLGHSGKGVEKLDTHLKNHLARAKKKWGTK